MWGQATVLKINGGLRALTATDVRRTLSTSFISSWRRFPRQIQLIVLP